MLVFNEQHFLTVGSEKPSFSFDNEQASIISIDDKIWRVLRHLGWLEVLNDILLIFKL